MPETADVGDGGSVFTTSSAGHKRLRIERIHGAVKKSIPPPKRRCLGGGRVSGRSRENLISGLISRADLVQQQQIAPIEENRATSSERHLPASFRRQRTTALNPTVTGTIDSGIVRRYSEMRAETDARVREFRIRHPPIFFVPDIPRVSTAAAQEPQPMQSGAEPPLTHDLVAPTLPAASQEVASPPSSAQEVAPVPPTSSMLQSFAFDDTRDGYSNDPNSLF